VSEKGRTETDKIYLEFPRLVSRVNLFCRISRCTPKGRRDKWSRQCHGLPMSLPDIADQDVPVPEFHVIRWVNLDRTTPETQQQVRVV